VVCTCGLVTGTGYACVLAPGLGTDLSYQMGKILASQLLRFWISGTYFVYRRSVGPNYGPWVNLVSSRSQFFNSSSILDHALIMINLENIPIIHNAPKSIQKHLFHFLMNLASKTWFLAKHTQNRSYLTKMPQKLV